MSTTAGELTNAAPAGESSLIQNLGRIRRLHQTAGSITVGGAGRTNATPNLNNGNVFIGDATNHSVARALVVADTTGLQSALDGKVDDSQVLTNVPSGALFTDTVYTHPTNHAISVITGLQSALDGKTTEAYVGTQIAALIDSSPATLDTLNELAAALGDDPNFATTVATSIAGKVDDSQVLTNVPAGALFTDTTYSVSVTVDLTQVNFTTADNTKLDGIATNCQQLLTTSISCPRYRIRCATRNRCTTYLSAIPYPYSKVMGHQNL